MYHKNQTNFRLNGDKVSENKLDTVRKKLYFAILLVVIFFSIGVYTYEIVEGWDMLTSIYFISATMTTVGYGDVVPHTELGRMATIIFMWLGISVGFYLIYTITEFREKEVDHRLIGVIRKVEGEGRRFGI
ncbi:potassium channel family protein [Candidatus Micrarchaeota archaeon]|nr:potassium channel family protein [Candidatus Micrarchaeota archaeon]